MKETFILRTEWYNSIKKLSAEEKATMLDLFFLYHIQQPNPNLNNLINLNNQRVELVWEIIEPNLKRNIEQYDKRIFTSSENGKKGGRPKNLNKPKKALSVSDSVFVSDSVTESVSVSDSVNVSKKKNTTETQLNDKLESLNKIGGVENKTVTTDKQFPCIHLPQSEIDKFDKFGTYRKMELLKYMNLFFELWVSKGEPKTKSQQQVILDTLYKQEYPVAIDGIMKAVSGGHRTIYFDQAKIKEHAKPTMPRMDTENLKKALETS